MVKGQYVVTTAAWMTLNRRTLVGLLWLVATWLSAAGAESRRVLLLHSFGRDFAPYDAVAGNLRTELTRQSPEPVDIYGVSLESARFRDTLQEGPFVSYLLALFSGTRLDLVVPLGGGGALCAAAPRTSLS